MGPTGLIADPGDPSTLDPIREALRETAVALLDAGVDAIVLETFRSPLEMQVALETVRALGAGPLFATMIFDSDRLTGDGLTPEQAAMLLARSGADVVGANCGEGPSVLSDVGIRMQVAGRPVLIQPNAGSPRRVDGRVLYMATPEYFGEYAKRNIANGVRAVGGCCGTTPEHIRQIAAEVRMVSGGASRWPRRHHWKTWACPRCRWRCPWRSGRPWGAPWPKGSWSASRWTRLRASTRPRPSRARGC
jgi:homocysteine S-methyltransferase